MTLLPCRRGQAGSVVDGDSKNDGLWWLQEDQGGAEWMLSLRGEMQLLLLWLKKKKKTNKKKKNNLLLCGEKRRGCYRRCGEEKVGGVCRTKVQMLLIGTTGLMVDDFKICGCQLLVFNHGQQIERKKKVLPLLFLKEKMRCRCCLKEE